MPEAEAGEKSEGQGGNRKASASAEAAKAKRDDRKREKLVSSLNHIRLQYFENVVEVVLGMNAEIDWL